MILSIESSCDDSSLAVTSIQDCHLLYHKKISQDSHHSVYGGVVPEIASRMHAIHLPFLLKDVFKHFHPKNFKAIAITSRPGLSVTLIEGLMMAKTLALDLKIPLIDVNHLKGHVYSLFINKKKAIHPLSTLLVSGGHTQILESYSHKDMTLVAESLDDSFGESFDKAARMLSLPYPGGPEIQKLSQEYDRLHPNIPALIPFPIPLKHHKSLAFSFSGLKNALRLQIQKSDLKDGFTKICIAKSFEVAACIHLVQQIQRYFKKSKNEYFSLVGGASANLTLRKMMEDLCKKYNKTLLLADLQFCTDNAAMIGRIAVESYLKGEFCKDILSLQPHPKSLREDFKNSPIA